MCRSHLAFTTCIEKGEKKKRRERIHKKKKGCFFFLNGTQKRQVERNKYLKKTADVLSSGKQKQKKPEVNKNK